MAKCVRGESEKKKEKKKKEKGKERTCKKRNRTTGYLLGAAGEFVVQFL